MPTIRGTLFVNPQSGARLPLEELAEAAREGGLEVIPLSPEVDIAGKVRDGLQRDRTVFVAAGGDGTVNSVIQGLINHPEAAVAVIPTGTYNHFARDLGIPLEWREALDVALRGRRRTVDTGRVNDRFFINNLSMGLYPDLVRRREERGRDYPRWKARTYALYMTMRKYRHVTITVESDHHNEVVRTHVFLVSNNSYDLSRIGIEASRAMLEEGRLSVYWLPHLSRWKLTRFVARYLAGRVRETPGFRSFRSSRLKIQSSKPLIRTGIDGEVATFATPLTVTIVPQSLQVMVPRD